MADDWDLQAVVRGCTTNAASSSCNSNNITSTSATTATNTTITTAATTTTSTSACGCSGDVYCFGSFEPQRDGNCLSFQDLLFEPRNIETAAGIQELHDLYKPFFPKSSPPLSPQSMPISPLSVLGGLQDLSSQQQQQLQQKQHQHIYQPKQQALSIGGSRTGGPSHNPSPRSKRRKNQLKRVCQVPAEALSSDMWSWRKYGQKPIKGSPYPRGYYRCSTSKGCLARKQVERNRSDPGMFIVTYTAEHNHPMPTHRNSLAGSTRQKPAATTQTTGNSDDPNNKHGSGSPPVSPSVSLSPAPADRLEFESSKEEIMEDEDDDINAPEMMMMPLEDDFFEGLEELTDKSAVDCFPDHFPQSMQFPWLSNNATTTAAGGG